MSLAGPAPGSPPGWRPAGSTPSVEGRRYAPLQRLSIALIIGGLVAVGAAVASAADLLTGGVLLPGRAERATGALALLLVGAVALLLGLVMNAVRSMVARETMAPERYRGPSVIVLWLLATIAANVAIVSVAKDVATLLGGGEPTLYGSIVALTVTQAALAGTAGLLVFVPRALAGVRLVPSRGVLRSMLIGLGLAVPSWIGAQLIAYLIVLLLEPFGLAPEPGIADQALSRAEPLVLLMALVVVAPLAEELFFRGVAFNAWEREYGTRRAVYGSALLFALVHGSIFFIPSILVLGIVLGHLYRATRSLPATIVLHAAFNAVSLGLALLVRYGVLDIPVT